MTDQLRNAAQRLHHLSMRYVGAFAELAKGERQAFIPMGYPGLSEMRDIIDLVLICRAELNAMTAVLAKLHNSFLKHYTAQVAEEYENLVQVKAKQLGCEVTDLGLSFTTGPGQDIPSTYMMPGHRYRVQKGARKGAAVELRSVSPVTGQLLCIQEDGISVILDASDFEPYSRVAK